MIKESSNARNTYGKIENIDMIFFFFNYDIFQLKREHRINNLCLFSYYAGVTNLWVETLQLMVLIPRFSSK